MSTLPMKLTLIYKDADKDTAKQVLELDRNAITLSAPLITAVADLLVAADALTGAQIIGCYLSYDFAIGNGIKTAPVAGSDVGDERLVFQFADDASLNYLASTSVPAYDDSADILGTTAIDETHPDVVAFKDAILNGPFVTHSGLALQTFAKVYSRDA